MNINFSSGHKDSQSQNLRGCRCKSFELAYLGLELSGCNNEVVTNDLVANVTCSLISGFKLKKVELLGIYG